MTAIGYFLKKIHKYAGKRMYFNLFGMMLMGFLEGGIILLLVPMISITGIVDVNLDGIPFMHYFQFLKELPISTGLPIILSGFVILVIGQHLLYRQMSIRNTIIHQGFLRHIRTETYQSVLYSNWDFFIKRRKSDIVNLLRTEISRTTSGINSLLQFFSSFIFTMIQVGLAFFLSAKITALVLCCGTILLIFNRKFFKKSLALGRRNYTLGKDYVAGVSEQINGMKDVKSNTLEASRMNWFMSITEKMQNEQVNYTKLRTTSQLYYKIASAILIAVFIYIAVQLFQTEGAQLLLIVVIFSRLWPTIADIQASVEKIATTVPAFEAVKQLQMDSKRAKELDESVIRDSGVYKLNESIRCQRLSFRYDKKRPSYALNNINLVIRANEMTAVVGKSGAGKSTLIDILMGLNEPEDGHILIDGAPLERRNLIAWRRAVSYVPQDPFLFNATIRENLQLVMEEADEKEMWKALEFSSAAEFVRNLPQGLDTLVGDRGMKLSGGERQRLVLARAILRKPSILILDEATSSLDTDNEARIQAALEGLKGKMTIVVIAHRLSTIQHADQVIVLDQGNVIQNGGFSQLSKDRQGVFRHLLHNQIGATR
ncbi:ABC transporter ATP-binding protein [Virgibacillus sp. W0181]|uniref:ABC transporter ATP-binding protein n=1 Tax=Virgibacillus sp. W0181 TaxID=3391581 RepID=UPI003F4629A7